MGFVEGTSLRFAQAARLLAEATRRFGRAAPAYRSPPRIAGDRSVRRRVDGGATISVRYRGRPWAAVLGDMIEGVVVTNRLRGPEADRLRTTLWSAVEHETDPEDRSSGPRLRAVA
jgi:hypothetical protein